MLTAPHWLKNAIFYGDPLFPLLRRWLPAHPWSAAAEAPYESWFLLRRPPWSLSGVLEMAKTLVTFSFVPHDFPQYHGERPISGSLFTLCTPLLVFVRNRRLDWLFGGRLPGDRGVVLDSRIRPLFTGALALDGGGNRVGVDLGLA